MKLMVAVVLGCLPVGATLASSWCVAHHGMSVEPDRCAWFTHDGGMACTDSSECEGVCVLAPQALDTLHSSADEHDEGAIRLSATGRPTIFLKQGARVPGVCSGQHFKPETRRCEVLVVRGELRAVDCTTDRHGA